MKKIIALFLLSVFMLCGCNQKDADVNQSSNNQPNETNNSSIVNDSSSQNQQTADKKTVGVIFLGGYEDYNQYTEKIKSSKYLSEYAFLGELPKSDFISSSDGLETFAIIPKSTTASVSVYKLIYDEELNKTQKGEEIYNSTEAKPIVVKCNFSDIYPDVNIKVTDKDGTVTEFSPKQSLKDGKLEIVSESKELVEDLTQY